MRRCARARSFLGSSGPSTRTTAGSWYAPSQSNMPTRERMPRTRRTCHTHKLRTCHARATHKPRPCYAHATHAQARIFSMEGREPTPWNLRHFSLEGNQLGDVGLQVPSAHPATLPPCPPAVSPTGARRRLRIAGALACARQRCPRTAHTLHAHGQRTVNGRTRGVFRRAAPRCAVAAHTLRARPSVPEASPVGVAPSPPAVARSGTSPASSLSPHPPPRAPRHCRSAGAA